jgi:hypothetical protein
MLGVLAVSVVAAATGELPASAQQVVHKVLGRAGVPAPGAAAKSRVRAATPTSRATTPQPGAVSATSTTAPRQRSTNAHDAATVRLLNLCHAWTDWSDHLWRRGQLGGNGGGAGWDGGNGNGGSAGSDGNWRHFSYNDLVTLSKAAGGVWRISAWCRRLADGGTDGATASSGAHGAARTGNPASRPDGGGQQRGAGSDLPASSGWLQ